MGKNGADKVSVLTCFKKYYCFGNDLCTHLCDLPKCFIVLRGLNTIEIVYMVFLRTGFRNCAFLCF